MPREIPIALPQWPFSSFSIIIQNFLVKSSKYRHNIQISQSFYSAPAVFSFYGIWGFLNLIPASFKLGWSYISNYNPSQLYQEFSESPAYPDPNSDPSARESRWTQWIESCEIPHFLLTKRTYCTKNLQKSRTDRSWQSWGQRFDPAYLHQNKKSFRKEWLFCFGWAYVAREALWFDRMHFCGAKAPLFLHAMQKT